MAAATSVYYGDYIYNTYIGYYDFTKAIVVQHPFLKTTQIPGNVIIMMESRKPNVMRSGATFVPINGVGSPNDYKDYFEKSTEIWNNIDPKTALAGQRPTPQNLPELRIGHPHTKNVKMNVLSADGHISLVDPYKDFFANPNDGSTVKDYLWDAKDVVGGAADPNWKKGMPGI